MERTNIWRHGWSLCWTWIGAMVQCISRSTPALQRTSFWRPWRTPVCFFRRNIERYTPCLTRRRLLLHFIASFGQNPIRLEAIAIRCSKELDCSNVASFLGLAYYCPSNMLQTLQDPTCEQNDETRPRWDPNPRKREVEENRDGVFTQVTKVFLCVSHLTLHNMM